MIDCYDFLGYD
jgi:hypothetical protein